MVPANQTRLLELLEAIKVEYDQLSQDAQITKSQRDEYEHKGKRKRYLPSSYFTHRASITVNSQIQEMNIFQQTLLDLERTQQVLKKQLRVFYCVLSFLYIDYLCTIDMRKRFLD